MTCGGAPFPHPLPCLEKQSLSVADAMERKVLYQGILFSSLSKLLPLSELPSPPFNCENKNIF